MLLKHIERDVAISHAKLVRNRGASDFIKIGFEYGDFTKQGIEVTGQTRTGERKVYGHVSIKEVFSDQALKELLTDEYMRKLFRL